MNTKKILTEIIENALHDCTEKGILHGGETPMIEVETPKLEGHGDFSTNIAMILASKEKKSPRLIADSLVQSIGGKYDILAKVEVAGPGFINFFFTNNYWHESLQRIEEQGDCYGRSNVGAGKRVQVEFVSANPTGPLHIGHGRGAAVGDVLANILEAAGYSVVREYYINDAGNQIETLGRSVYFRYLQLSGRDIDFPAECYQGDYIIDIAREMAAAHGDRYLRESDDRAVSDCAVFASERVFHGIKNDLEDFGVEFDEWFSEKTLFEENKVLEAVEELKAKGFIYLKDDAFWFRSAEFGDEKDRVVVRSDGQPTYFASDIAYHKNKLERGFHMIINIWGADHHGYVPRMESVIQALGKKKEVLRVLLVQLVNLLRDGQQVAMSTRSGEFDTLEKVVKEVGKDAARYFFLMRNSDSPLDFDLELAKQESTESPVYYVQYAHARISSILNLALERGIRIPEYEELPMSLLNLPEEIRLVKQILRYPEVVEGSALSLEPHRITAYLNELTGSFHSYYNKNRVISDDHPVTVARLFLVRTIRTVIGNALGLLGVGAPEKM